MIDVFGKHEKKLGMYFFKAELIKWNNENIIWKREKLKYNKSKNGFLKDRIKNRSVNY